MAATVADRSSLALQRCSEPVVSVARPMLVTIGAPGSIEGRPVRLLRRCGHSFGDARTQVWARTLI